MLIPDIYKGAVGVDKEEASHLMGALDWCAALHKRRTHAHARAARLLLLRHAHAHSACACAAAEHTAGRCAPGRWRWAR